jgi:cyclophilin family peptidyl-prolyl cis-trans isomerase
MLISAGSAPAQTAREVRFTTNVGSFDMILNPQRNARLQPLVDNILAYIGLGSYDFSAINRAHENGAGVADDFVLQMGTFLAGPTDPNLWATVHTPIETLAPVILDANNDDRVDFTAGSNTFGTVSMALASIPNDPEEKADPNSGTSSFFVNMGDNSVLDPKNFVPFARIEDTEEIRRIMRLPQTDLTQEAGVDPGNLAFKDVPLAPDGQIVYITDVDVLSADDGFSFCGPIVSAIELMKARNAAANNAALTNPATSIAALTMAEAAAETPIASAAQLATGAASAAATSSAAITAVPEPGTIALGVLSAALTWLASRRRMAR